MTKSFAIKCEFSCFVEASIKDDLNAMIFVMGIYFYLYYPTNLTILASKMHFFGAIFLFLSPVIKIILKFIYKIVNGTQITFLVQ